MRLLSSRTARLVRTIFAIALAAMSVAGVEAPPLRETSDGKKIRSSAKWELLKRPELESALATRAGYGPFRFTEVASFASHDQGSEKVVLDGSAALKQSKIAASTLAGLVMFDVSCFLPRAGLVGAAPVFLFLCTPDWEEKIAPGAAAEDDEFWPVATLVSRGYAAVSFSAEQVSPEDGTNAVARWAAAARAAMDWIEKDSRLDASRVALVGHSATGEAALWAFAADRRFSMLCCTVSRLLKARGSDFRDLVALAAPRPVRIASASSDAIGGESPEAKVVAETAFVWDLYGKKDACRHRERPGPHGLTRSDWEFFLSKSLP